MIDVSEVLKRKIKEMEDEMYLHMSPWDIVTAFESEIARYTGAKYCVCVDSCTNALLLALSYSFRGVKKPYVELPMRTYVGVAQSVLNAGGKIHWIDYDWKDFYIIYPVQVVDSARMFKRNLYESHRVGKNRLVCLSFHWNKSLKIGKGGAILTDDKDAAWELRKMRYDGRTERVHPKDDTFSRGFHCYMSPADAATGLLLMQNPKDEYEDTEDYNYSDLSLQEVFR